MVKMRCLRKTRGIADDIGTEVALCGVGVVLLKNQWEFLCWSRIRLSLLDFSIFIIVISHCEDGIYGIVHHNGWKKVSLMLKSVVGPQELF